MKETFSFGQYLKHGLRQEEAHDARGNYANYSWDDKGVVDDELAPMPP